ncbi:choline transporter-like protein 1 [Halyomorpha halys]|uniref:choline transporter-like protein 1 n=1 Tax=Halyomorpha halys TaxID=286706 RepID=UPI0006D509B6|nr:choline transporter-like protein 1 [Halyomorpha halys]
MGSCLCGDKVEPEAKNAIDGPVSKRSCTDTIWILIMAAFVVCLFGLVGHCIAKGDILRVIYGYDNCGNICGIKNEPESDPKFSCKGEDMTAKKYLLIKEAGKFVVNPRNVYKECVSDCSAYPEYRKFLRRCIPKKSTEVVNSFFSTTGLKDFFLEVSEDLHLTWLYILLLSFFALALSFLVLFLLQYVAGAVVWLVLIGTVVVSLVAAIYLWIVWKDKRRAELQSDISQRMATTYLVFAIIATIVTIVILLIILVMRKRIKLVVQLFREAGKAVSSMPLLLLQPIATFIALTLTVGLWIYFSLWIESSGYLHDGSPYFYYKKDTAMKVTRWYNLLAMFWMTQFCIGCQHMVIGGAVATWFFTRDKSELSHPIKTSTKRLIKYHLGSVAFGSLLIALVQFVRAILSAIYNQTKDAQGDIGQAVYKACHCCLYCFEKVLTYLTRNAYIEIAIYGNNFCWSGEQAVKILTNNALRVFAINSVGDFVLFLSKVLVVSFTVLVGFLIFERVEGIQHMWVLLSLLAVFAYLISHCFITVYEMVIDTIFICFCEDCEINDGVEKPYFMSYGLMEFVQNTKKVLAVGDRTS